MGPHGYVSSSWLADRTRTPTWNYATVQYVVDIEFMDSPQETDALLQEQVATMEAGRPNAWQVPEMGARYGRIVGGIIGFHAHIRDRRPKFKLGQDERDAEYADIQAKLGSGNAERCHFARVDASLEREPQHLSTAAADATRLVVAGPCMARASRLDVQGRMVREVLFASIGYFPCETLLHASYRPRTCRPLPIRCE